MTWLVGESNQWFCNKANGSSKELCSSLGLSLYREHHTNIPPPHLYNTNQPVKPSSDRQGCLKQLKTSIPSPFIRLSYTELYTILIINRMCNSSVIPWHTAECLRRRMNRQQLAEGLHVWVRIYREPALVSICGPTDVPNTSTNGVGTSTFYLSDSFITEASTAGLWNLLLSGS